MTRTLLAALAAAVLLVQPGFAGDDHDHGGESHSRHEGEANGVRAVHAWTRATADGAALIFVDIENGSDETVSIVGGDAGWAEAVELVGFQLKDGEPAYAVLPAVPVKPGTEMVLAPNGLALRASGVRQPLVEGEEYEIEIEFDFGHVEMMMQVEAANAVRHSHAGHQH